MPGEDVRLTVDRTDEDVAFDDDIGSAELSVDDILLALEAGGQVAIPTDWQGQDSRRAARSSRRELRPCASPYALVYSPVPGVLRGTAMKEEQMKARTLALCLMSVLWVHGAALAGEKAADLQATSLAGLVIGPQVADWATFEVVANQQTLKATLACAKTANTCVVKVGGVPVGSAIGRVRTGGAPGEATLVFKLTWVVVDEVFKKAVPARVRWSPSAAIVTELKSFGGTWWGED